MGVRRFKDPLVLVKNDLEIGNQVTKVGNSAVATFKSGTNITYSGGKGHPVLDVDLDWSGVAGGVHGIYLRVDSTGVVATDGAGVIGLKSLVTQSAAVTDGEFYGGQFIVKKTGSGTATASSSHIGVEGWFYETDSSILRTGIGGNFGWHNDSTGAAHGAGSVHRGIQIFCDNAGTSAAEESTGLCIWNQAGTVDNAINVVHSGSGFTYFLKAATASGFLSANTGAPATPTHRIAVQVAGVVRYIPCYTP